MHTDAGSGERRLRVAGRGSLLGRVERGDRGDCRLPLPIELGLLRSGQRMRVDLTGGAVSVGLAGRREHVRRDRGQGVDRGRLGRGESGRIGRREGSERRGSRRADVDDVTDGGTVGIAPSASASAHAETHSAKPASTHTVRPDLTKRA